MRLDFSVQTDDVFSAAVLADADPHDAYKAAQPILADDWDCPEDAHWDKL